VRCFFIKFIPKFIKLNNHLQKIKKINKNIKKMLDKLKNVKYNEGVNK